jgi:hypothetical protein
MRKTDNIDVIRRMVDTDDKACMMAPLSFIVGMDWTAKKNLTIIRIALEGNHCLKFENGDYVGGLFLIDKKRFNEVKAELEKG